MRHLLVIILSVCAMTLPCGQSSAETPVRILQYKNDRLYFPVGEEDLVVRDCRFAIYVGDDSLYNGQIEQAGLGFAYSYPTENWFDTINIDSCLATVEVCVIDSTAEIILGTTGYGAFVGDSVFSGAQITLDTDTVVSTGYGSGSLRVLYYETIWEMQLDYEAGLLDGCFSYRPLSQSPGRRACFSRTPYLAVLLPSLSTVYAEDNTLVTTSLYYRLGQDRLSATFDGTDIQPVDCFSPRSGDCVRSYGYDPDRGRSLIRQIRNRSRRFVVSYDHENLREAGLFFTDLLSQDRLSTRLSFRADKTACHVRFVPFAPVTPVTPVAPVAPDDEICSMRHILKILVADTVPGNRINERVALLGSYLDLAEQSRPDDTRRHFCHLAELSLSQDLGTFPLFRPTVFFTSQDNIRNEPFDESGRFRLDGVMKIVRPDTTKRETP